MNPLHRYRFGTVCGEGGYKPKGRSAIEYFVANNNVPAIKEAIKGYYPEGRLYAIEALLTMVKENKVGLSVEEWGIIKKFWP